MSASAPVNVPEIERQSALRAFRGPHPLAQGPILLELEAHDVSRFFAWQRKPYASLPDDFQTGKPWDIEAVRRGALRNRSTATWLWIEITQRFLQEPGFGLT